RSRGSVSARNRSRPGFARPIEFSIPTSVSAIRTGALPPRGSGVTVFVTNASSERATSGAVSASRQPEAFRSTGRLYCCSGTITRRDPFVSLCTSAQRGRGRALRRDGEVGGARGGAAGGRDRDAAGGRPDRDRGRDLARGVDAE